MSINNYPPRTGERRCPALESQQHQYPRSVDSLRGSSVPTVAGARIPSAEVPTSL